MLSHPKGPEESGERPAECFSARLVSGGEVAQSLDYP
jgi:hypothetical protein